MKEIKLTMYYVEPKLSWQGGIQLGENDTVETARRRAHKSLKNHLRDVARECGLTAEEQLVYPSHDSVIFASDQVGFAGYDDPKKPITLQNNEHLYALVPAPPIELQTQRQLDAGASLAACAIDSSKSLFVAPMIERLKRQNSEYQEGIERLERQNSEYEEKIKELEDKLKSKKAKGKKGKQKVDMEALLQEAKRQVTAEIKATLEHKNEQWQREVEAKNEERMKQREKVVEELKGELEAKEGWGTQFDAQIGGTKEQMKAELRAELEEERREREEHKTKTAEKLNQVTYAMARALLRKDLLPLRALQYRAVLDNVQQAFAEHLNLGCQDSLAWRQSLSAHSSDTTQRIAHAKSLLVGATQFQRVLDSTPAMTLICELKSTIRHDGNDIAHTYGHSAEDLLELKEELELILKERAVGMAELIDLLSSLRFPSSTPVR